ncbi:MAG: adenosylcobinamide-GDP ribazoletransferase [Candidatus Firestonebacteria bacterium]|nr:adenosylcobinamide-GDP ribazoletransferase [Candidatus Firestonebacteria bacterium]
MFNAFIAALQFLTRISIKKNININDELLLKSMIFFPVVGGIIGLVQAIIYLGVYRFVSSLISAVLLVIIPIILTGAFHMEGFADMTDGFLSGRTKEKILLIMKESTVGTMGAIGISCLILVKFVFYKELTNYTNVNHLMLVLILIQMLSRWAMVISASISKNARDGASLARAFTDGADLKLAVLSGIIPVISMILFLKIYGLIAVAITICISMYISNISKKKIGGITGDVLGAINEITEIGLLFYMIVIKIK